VETDIFGRPFIEDKGYDEWLRGKSQKNIVKEEYIRLREGLNSIASDNDLEVVTADFGLELNGYLSDTTHQAKFDNAHSKFIGPAFFGSALT
jgi:hypothetical protein